jgi:hypothetical protein
VPHRILAASTRFEQQSKIVVRVAGAIGVTQDGLMIGLDRFFRAAPVLEEHRQVEMRRGVLGIALHGALVMGFRLAQLARFVLQSAQIEVCVREPWMGRDRRVSGTVAPASDRGPAPTSRSIAAAGGSGPASARAAISSASKSRRNCPESGCQEAVSSHAIARFPSARMRTLVRGRSDLSWRRKEDQTRFTRRAGIPASSRPRVVRSNRSCWKVNSESP